MVYKVTRYVCEGCGSSHSHEEEAKQCEYRCEEIGKIRDRKPRTLKEKELEQK